jgi:hypothetical protein
VTSRNSDKAGITNRKLLVNEINLNKGGRARSVGTGTRYGLDGPGFELWWSEGSQAEPRPASRPKQPPI